MLCLPRYLNLDTELICQTIGHKVEWNDGGYEVCSRCGAHGYYDYAKFTYKWHNWICHFLVWLYGARWTLQPSNIIYHLRWNFRRCQKCGRFRFICNRSRCSYRDEIPF